MPRWADTNGDGIDDNTRLTQAEFTRRYAAENGQAYHDRRAQLEYDRAVAEYDEYVSSGQQRSDIDAGRAPREDPRRSGGPNALGRPDPNASARDRASEGERILADIPIIGDAKAAQFAAEDSRSEAERMRAEWEGVKDNLPTANDLWVQYEEEGNVAGPERSEAANVFADQGLIDKQGAALGAFEDIVNSGGLTSADRAKMALGEQEMGRAMRSQRDADMSQLRARGMGGSGAAVQSMLSAQQGGADMLAGREAQMQIEAQRRRDAAIGAMGDMAGGMRDQGFNEGAYRGEAADSFNRYQTDYQRGREQRNTGHRNRTRESRAESRVTSAQLGMDATAGMSNQWRGSSADAQSSKADEDEAKQRQAGALEGIFRAVAG